MNYKFVYIVQHENPVNEDVKLIGVFSSRRNANLAVEELKEKSGFSESADAFFVDRYELNKIFWTHGFVTVENQ